MNLSSCSRIMPFGAYASFVDRLFNRDAINVYTDPIRSTRCVYRPFIPVCPSFKSEAAWYLISYALIGRFARSRAFNRAAGRLNREAFFSIWNALFSPFLPASNFNVHITFNSCSCSSFIVTRTQYPRHGNRREYFSRELASREICTAAAILERQCYFS